MKWEEFKPLIEKELDDYPHMCPDDLPKDRTIQVPGKIPEEFDEHYLDAWKKAGRPYVWVMIQERIAVPLYSIPTYGRIELWQDRGHGWLALYCDNGKGKVYTGKETVYNDTLTIFALDEYWGVEEPELFIRI